MGTVKINPFTGQPELSDPTYGLSIRGVTKSDMTPSTTSIVCPDLAGYGDDYFNGYFMQVLLGNHELLTIDGAPAPADFAAAATLTGATSLKTCAVVAKLTSTTYIVKSRSGTFTDGEVISDGTNSCDCGAGFPTFAGGAAPEMQIRAVTDYVSATGTFTVAAFGQVVEPLSEVLLVHDSLIALGTNDANNVYDSSAVTSNRDGSILERTEFIIDALQGTQFRTERSAAGTVEENAIQQFTISLYDLDLGAIASANINITAITNVMSKSTGGGAFSAVGITQPTFAKANGTVSCAYQFLAAEWTVGDIYRLIVEGITATVDTETVYCPTMVWSNVVLEAASIDTNVETILSQLSGSAGVATFPAAANPGDAVSLAEVIRAILTSMVGGDDYDGYTNISNSANASLDAIVQKFAAAIGIDGANTFSSTIQGSGRTTVEAAFDFLATYFSASGAAMAMKVQDGTERTNLEQILEDYFAVVGCDGANLFNPTIQGTAQTTLDTALAQLAVYFAASGAAISIQLNNQTARTNLEQVLEDYFTLVGVDGTNVLTNINNSANATFNAVWQKFAALWGADGTNVFNPTIQGAAKTTLESALEEMAKYLAPSGAAISVTMNNGSAVTTLEEVWEAWLAVVGVDGTNQFTNISNSSNTTFNAVFQKFAAAIGIDGTNTFSSTIQGSGRTTVEAAFDFLATYFSASGAAMAMKVQDGTERTNLEQILEDYFAVVGCDGANLFNPTIQGTAQTTLDTALAQLAVYFAASGAAISIQLNNQTARTNLEQVLEDYFTLVGVDGTNVLTNINNSANATFNAVWQKFAALWGADGTNVFNPTIQGAAKTTLESALEELAKYLAPSGAAISVTMNNGSAVTTLEEVWEAWLAVVGVDGTNQFTNISNSSNTTFNAVFQKFAAAIGIDGANTFSATVAGSSQATVEAAFTAVGSEIDIVQADTAATAAGKLQIVSTTESLNQEAATYDLLTGTTQAVVLEKLNCKMATGNVGGALTSISIQTDDATPGVIISAVPGAVANLLSEADISWTGALLINVGTKIQITIAGGAHGSAYVATVVAQYRSVVAGGTLAA